MPAGQSNTSDPNLTVANQPTSEPKVITPSSLKLPRVLIAVFFLILLVGLGVGGYYWYTKNSKTSLEKETYQRIREMKAKPWDPQRFPITARVREVNKGEKILLLDFSWPPHVAGKSQNVRIDCKDDDFWKIRAFERNEAFPAPENISSEKFFGLVTTGEHYFTGFCSDKDCFTINRGCRILPQ